MKKPWSISTTVRNPYRIRDFLGVLSNMEGEEWSRPNQRRFQIMLIQFKKYGYGKAQFLNSLSPEHRRLMENPEPLTFEEAESILDSKNYVGGGAMRGRQSFNPLEKMGLALLDGRNRISISEFGRYFLSDDYDLGEVFLRSFVKWQLPNPDAEDYPATDGFSIKPFIATLHVIKRVNELWAAENEKPVGISLREFGIFLPLMIHSNQIEQMAADIVAFRRGRIAAEDKKVYSAEFRRTRVRSFLGEYATETQVTATMKKLLEYADNAKRYFRLTRLLQVRGGGYYLDLEPLRAVDIAAILATDNAQPEAFADPGAYRAYMDEFSDVLPWETLTEVRQSIKNTESALEDFSEALRVRGITTADFLYKDSNGMDVRTAKSYLEELRKHRRILYEAELLHVAQDPARMREYIEKLGAIRGGTGGLELEWLVTGALNAIDDAEAIKPNYPVGDDGEPTFTAPGGAADIECFYGDFNATCEVTMLRTRDQWFNEGQPVMRHLRDFELAHAQTPAYCIFIAPSIHTDTAETYWTSIRHGYRGGQQNIVPLTINQLISILKFVLNWRAQGNRFTKQHIRQLFDAIVSRTAHVGNSDEWVDGIQSLIEQWQEAIGTT